MMREKIGFNRKRKSEIRVKCSINNVNLPKEVEVTSLIINKLINYTLINIKKNCLRIAKKNYLN